jgi:hypothetical protein
MEHTTLSQRFMNTICQYSLFSKRDRRRWPYLAVEGCKGVRVSGPLSYIRGQDDRQRNVLPGAGGPVVVPDRVGGSLKWLHNK